MRKCLIIIYASMCVLTTYAQGKTFNHDASFLQQFLVTEGFGGKLTPAMWYELFHNDYSHWALSTGKSIYRSDFMREIDKEEGYSEKIDSAMFKRAEQEVIYMVDRTASIVDIAWQAEGAKVEAKLKQFDDAINSLSSYGVPYREIESFRTQYNCITFGLNEVRKAYMPTSKRREQYIAIQEDLTIKTKKAYDFLFYYDSLRKINRMSEGQRVGRAKIASIASSVRERWSSTLSAVSKSSK